MPNIKVPEQLYEKIKELAEKEGKAMWEVIQAALDKMEVGDIQLNLPKPKFIRLHYPAWCILGHHKIDPQKYKEKYGRDPYALWFPGLNGVICIDCLVKHVFTEEVQVKTLAKLEVEIRKLKAIKRQLNKEVEELAVKYSFAELLAGLREIIDGLDARMKTLSDLAMEFAFCKDDPKCEEKKKELRELKAYLEEVKRKLEKLEVPESWIKKGLEKMGIVVKVPRRRERIWEESRSGFWR